MVCVQGGLDGITEEGGDDSEEGPKNAHVNPEYSDKKKGISQDQEQVKWGVEKGQ